MDNKNQALYQQVILDHNKNPRNYKEMKGHTHSSEGYNPLCGDHLWVYMNINSQKEIEDISFQGEGCAICKASASLMTTTIKGKNLSSAKNTINQFQHLLKGDPLSEDSDAVTKSKRLMVFSEIWKYPSRVKCAALAWHAASSAIDKEKEAVSTE